MGAACLVSGAAFAQEEGKTEEKIANNAAEESNAAGASARSAVEVLEEVPSRFSIVKDGNDQVWDIKGDGAVYHGSGPVFDGAMQLFVGGAAFAPNKARKDDVEVRFWLTEEREALTVERDIVLDAERGALRYFDTFTNKRDEDMELKILYHTTFQQKPTRVFTNGGKEFEGKFGSKHAGIVLQGADKRPGVVMVVSGERSAARATLGVTDDKKFRQEFSLVIPKGKTLGLVQWIAQCEVADAEAAEKAFAEFYKRQRLWVSHLPEDKHALVANFAAVGEGPEAPDADDLLVVERLCEKLDVERLDEDLLWVASGNPLTGEAKGSTARASGRFGDLEVPLAELAALQGGSGRGRAHRVFFRDGDVLAGEVSAEGLQMQGSKGWKIDLEVAQLDTIVFRLSETDGVFPEGVDTFIELHSGDVLGFESGDREIGFITPWGSLHTPLSEITLMKAVKVPSPRYRVTMNDGAELTVFLENQPLEIASKRFGSVSVPASEISAVWKAGSDADLGVVEEVEEREDFEGIKFTACLLKGSNVLAGEVANEKLHLLANATVTALSPSEIVRIRRADDDLSDIVPLFVVELSGGSELTGRFQERTVTIRGTTREWRVPIQHFLASQRIENGESEQ